VDSDDTSSDDDEEELQDQVNDVNESMISFGRQFTDDKVRGSICANMKHFKNLKKV